ncbi:MAG: hypothetical protein GX878_09545 [Firmicutes bacterium]|nr:hypothetical protein [Bacillota bacterium]
MQVKKRHLVFLCVLLILSLTGCQAAPQGAGNGEAAETGNGVMEEDEQGSVIMVGQSQEKDGITVKLEKLILSKDPGLFNPPPEDHVFLYPVFTITNLHQSEHPLYFMSGSSCIAYVDGEEFKRNMDGLYSYGGDIEQLDLYVDHNTSAQAMTAFVIPEDWKEIELVVNQGFDPLIDPINLSFKIENR